MNQAGLEGLYESSDLRDFGDHAKFGTTLQNLQSNAVDGLTGVKTDQKNAIAGIPKVADPLSGMYRAPHGQIH